MGAHGPVPKRSDQRRRRNAPEMPTTTAPSGEQVTPPEPDQEWHPIAHDWYVALARSGQSVYYEASDWATARYVAEAMSRNLAAGRFSAQLFAAVMSASTTLLATEGDRRRLQVELQRHGEPSEHENVPNLDDYRARAS